MKKGTIILIVLMSFCWTLQGQTYSVERGSEGGSWNVLKNNKHKCAFECDIMTSNRWPYFSVKKDDKWGIIDADCEMVLPYQYDYIQALYNDYFKVKKGDLYGVIDAQGDTVLDYIYEDIDSYTDDLSIVKINGNWTYIDQSGKAIEKERIYFKNWDFAPLYELCDEDEKVKTDQQCGDLKLIQYIYGTMRYPSIARANRVQGTVVIQFDISPEGEIHDVTIIRDIGDGCGDAALEVVESMDLWYPAEAHGQKVWSKYTLPVKFKLESR